MRSALRPAMAASAPLVGLAATARVQRRSHEYWGLHVSARTQPYAQGDKLPDTYNVRMVDENDKDAMYLTGNGANVAYDGAMYADRAAEGLAVKDRYRLFNGVDKYILDPISEKESAAVAALWEVAAADGFELFWAKLFKLYPQLKIPFDDATKAELIAVYGKTIPLAHDEALVQEATAAYMLKMLEEKHINRTYWFRFCESAAEALIEGQQLKAYESRRVRVVLERMTKCMHNNINAYPWATHDMTSPYEFDICGNRMWHEAGMW